MRNIACLLVACLFLITGCKIDDPGLALTGNTYNTYLPVTKGTFWKYTITTVTVKDPQTETQTITGSRDLINKKIYYTIRTQNAPIDDTLSHYSHEGENYTIRSFSSSGGFSVEYLYLKDNPVAGKTWTANVTDDGLINGIPARIQGIVVEKDITKNIAGKKFTNVVHTLLQFQYDEGTGYETTQLIHYYIAKGIGIIEVDYSDGKSVVASRVLADYDIK